MTAIVIASTLKAVKKMRLGDLDSLFCRFWGKADPFKEQTLVRPCTVWSDAATMVREAPTIDPETIPVVRQLREELALITQQRDIYKSVFEHITSHGDCNDCEDAKGCRFAPGIGEDTRYNCPLIFSGFMEA